MATTIFGQVVVGPPGSGKSTYCKYICENLKQLGRNAKIINLDPANDCLPYKPALDITELINVQQVMEKTKIGPNGAMIRCIELLNENVAWLFDNIVSLIEKETSKSDRARGNLELQSSTDIINKNKPYLIIDCPGQTELYTHNTAMRDIISKLSKTKLFDLRLVCLNLCDAHLVKDTGKFIGLLLNSLSTMLNLGLPHLNVLSKVDLIETNGETRFNLDFYCEVMNLKYLLDTELESPFYTKYRKLSEAIISVIEDYSLVTFRPLNIRNAEHIYEVIRDADKANGYYINDLDLAILQLNPNLMEMASGRRLEPLEDTTMM